jgi:hypothetical protein
MRIFAKAPVLLLLAAVMMAPMAAPQLDLVGAPHQRPAGCHENGSKAPEPVSHRCCQAGHHAAIVQQYLTLPSPRAISLGEFAEPQVIARAFGSLRSPAIPRGSPPTLPSLRI